MKNVRNLLLFVVVLCTYTPSFAEAPQEQKESTVPEKTTSYWMKAKMDYSSAILAAMASGDFGQVEKSADQMLKLGKVEGFIRKNNQDYRKQLKEFERVLKNLKNESQKKDMEGVAKQFGQLTFSCVRCHQILRKLETPSPKPR